MTGSPAGATPLLSLGSKSCANARPCLWPAVGARQGAQCHQWIDVSARPVHTAALESRLDHDLVRAFSAATANRVAGGLKRRVLHLGQAFGEVRHGAIPRFRRGVGSSARWIGNQATAESTCRALSAACLSVCACSSSHAFNSGVAVPSTGWGRGRQVLDGVWEIQDPHRVRSKHIYQPLFPFGAILHRAHHHGGFGPTTVSLDVRLAGEGLRWQVKVSASAKREK
jgi:hypothetical protein